VTPGDSYLLDVIGAAALLTRRQRVLGGVSSPLKYGTSGCIPALVSSVVGSVGTRLELGTTSESLERKNRGIAGEVRGRSWKVQ
jgi:hypothetical protein